MQEDLIEASASRRIFLQMILLIDIFSINKGRGYENPSLEIIVTERFLIGGCPLEEACEHCFLNQSAISIAIGISFLCIVKIMRHILLLFCHFQHFISVLYILYIWYLAFNFFFLFPSLICLLQLQPQILGGNALSHALFDRA